MNSLPCKPSRISVAQPIPYGHQHINDDDIQAVVDVLRSDWLTQGPTIERFEQEFAEFCGARYAVAVSNATAALHLACRALDLGPQDSLWTSPNTFVASANCARFCGAGVDFVDIDPKTYNLSPDRLTEKLELARRDGDVPRVVVPVHFAGQPCEMEAIRSLAQEYGFALVEDASHAVGADYHHTRIGSCHYSDITVFSFHPVKIMTTGEGGIAVTNDSRLFQRLKLLRSHGLTRDPEMMEAECAGGWYYEQQDLGYNYRITDIQAALGCSQLRRVEEFLARRRSLVARYAHAFRTLPLVTPWESPGGHSAWHLYVIQLNREVVPGTRREVFDKLRASGIQVNVHYFPVHLQPYYRQMGFKPGDFPCAEAYYESAITLPLYYGLTDQGQDFVIETLIEALH